MVSHHWSKIDVVTLLVLGSVCVLLISLLWNHWYFYRQKRLVLAKAKGSVLLGVDAKSGEKIYLREEFRTSHTQVIGTTNAGKTASVILPWAVQDIQQGRGLIIIDGKADKSFLETLYAHALANNRESDFMVFSLASTAVSKTFNPFVFGSPQQIAERVFAAFEITDPYYGSVQFSIFKTLIELLIHRGEIPTPSMVRTLLRDQELLLRVASDVESSPLAKDIQKITSLKSDEYEKRTSGLVAALDHFSSGGPAKLFNTSNSEINLLDVVLNKRICYFQLPTMQSKFLGSSTGKLLLQCLQSTVSDLQVRGKAPDSLFSVYLDDFNDYMYPDFASLLNKSRSANIGVVFSHQSLGDLEKVAPEFKQIVLTNTNVKVIMRSNDPETAEHFAASIGTTPTEKITWKRQKMPLWNSNTGEQSVRETEEYIFHPNVFKSELKRGEGVTVIPHPMGTEIRRIRFSMAAQVPAIPLPVRHIPEIDFHKYLSFRYPAPNPADRMKNVSEFSAGGRR